MLNRLNKKVNFAISVDGIRNFESRGVSFDESKKTILALKEKGFPVMIWFSPTRLNLGDLCDVATWCRERGLDCVVIDLHTEGRAIKYKDILLDESDYDRYMEELGKYYSIYPEDFLDKYDVENEGLPIFNLCYRFEFSLRMCKGGRSFAYVASNGDVFPCSNCATEDMFNAGNTREKTFLDIWNNSFVDFRKIVWSDFKGCTDCEVAKVIPNCKLRCPPLSKVIHDDMLVCGASELLKRTMIARATPSELERKTML
jgi:radical SAM protein with 4Fe4S-binding SPASM domain